jgi:hypothetical protein
LILAGVGAVVLAAGLTTLALGWEKADHVASVVSAAVALIGLTVTGIGSARARHTATPPPDIAPSPDTTPPPRTITSHAHDQSQVNIQGQGTMNITERS